MSHFAFAKSILYQCPAVESIDGNGVILEGDGNEVLYYRAVGSKRGFRFDPCRRQSAVAAYALALRDRQSITN
jgi:hypothetical protein